MSWRVEYAEDATSKMIRALIPVLTHEMLHACDEKALTADVSVISDTLEIPSADIARSYFMHYLSPSVEYANATNEHTWQEFSDQHLTSIASDSYGYFSQKEHVAQLGEHFLTRLLLGYDYYEVYFDARRPVDSSFDAEVKWGVKNKICQPHVQEQARIFLHKIGLFEDLNLDNDLGCSAELLPSGLSLTDSIKKLEGVP